MNWESGDSVVGVYSDARTEYTKQLCVFLVPAYFQFFIQLLEKAKVATTAEPKKCLWQFQNYLNEIPEWNMEKVSIEIAALQDNCGCDYLEDLLTAVFIAHTKVLTAIRVSSKQKKIQINVPKVEHFLYKVLCESSKLLWGSTYLFRDGITSIEKQQNFRNVEKLLTEAVGQAVRAMVPVKSILRDFVAADEEEEETVGSTSSTTQVESEKPVENEIIMPAASSTLPGASSALPEAGSALPEVVAPALPEFEDAKPEPEAALGKEDLTSGRLEDASDAQAPGSSEMPEANQEKPPTIVVDTASGVTFSGYDTILDEDNPEKSDILEHKEYAEPELEILDEVGVPMDDDSDVEDLDNTGEDSDSDSVGTEIPIGSNEYDVIV